MIKTTINGFLQRDGVHIMYATFAARLLSFFASWIALKLIPNFELGSIIYAQNIIAMLIPLSGFGATQGLLRFGALEKTKETQQKLFLYTIRKGIFFSGFIIIFISIVSSIIPLKLQSAQPYLIILSFQLITLFLLENLKTYFRVIHQNKKYAQIEVTYNLLLVILVFTGSFFLKEDGYITAIVITPLIIFLWFYKGSKIQIIKKIPVNESIKTFWNYSFFAGLSNVTSQLLIILDIILIGNILNDPEKITLYKYLTIIPFSLLFLPRVLLMTDFVTLTQRYENKDYILKYIRSYILIFSVFSFIVVTIGCIFSTQILLFFGNEFIGYENVFITILFGISGILILRGLFGNLLSVIGKASINFWISLIGIVINIISNLILIPQYGILGAAITSAVIMWITSIISAIIFFNLYKKII